MTRERRFADGRFEVEVLRDDGETIAAVRVWPPEKTRGLETYPLEVSTRAEEPGPRDLDTRRFQTGQERALLPARTS